MSLFLAISLFAFSMSVSPGPVNMVTLSAGLNFGLPRTLPFVLGAALGFTTLLLAVGLGLAQLVDRAAWLLDVLALAGCVFICYMGYRIATSPVTPDRQLQHPPRFLQGALLQWLNPKAWIACLACVSAFGLAQSYTLLLLCSALYGVICLLSIGLWAFAGDRLHLVIADERRLVLFNRLMGVALVLVACYLLYLQLAPDVLVD